MESIWQSDVTMPAFPPLSGERHTDVLIIGGGIVGILTAYTLKQQGIDCILVEKQRLCTGTTGHTTAKLTVQHGAVYHRIRKRYGLETAKQYLQANLQAFDVMRTLCMQYSCAFASQDNYVYSCSNRTMLEQEMETLHAIGAKARFQEHLSLPIQTCGGICFPDQAQFHPLKLLAALAAPLPIYEQTFVHTLDGTTAYTHCGSIHAKAIVIATHFPFLNRHGAYFLKLYQHRSYVLALEHAGTLDGMYVDADKTGLSFRQAGAHLLLGGGGQRTGKSCGGWTTLRQFADRHYPAAQETAHWAAQDCMPLDDMPYIGAYGKHTDGLFVAAGFGKWGMTGAMAAALLLSDLVQRKPNPHAALFDPHRSMLHPQLLINGWEAVSHLLRLSHHRCPHMGCALTWNAAEHSWDCPCHGSRLTDDGHVLDNPANGT